jgi:hypothetical protein
MPDRVVTVFTTEDTGDTEEGFHFLRFEASVSSVSTVVVNL